MSVLFDAKRGLARAVGTLSRRSGRGGGTTLPGRLLVRMAPDAIDRLAARPRPRLDRGQLDQRQDDDRRDDLRHPPGGRPRARPQPSGLEHALGRRDRPARAARRRGSLRARRGAGCRGSRRISARACSCSATSSGTSSTATGSSSTSRTSGPSSSPDLEGSCEFALNADDPLIADLGRDRELRRRPGVTYFGIEDTSQALPELQHAHDAKHCRRCGAPYVYDRAFVGHLGHYTCPNCDADRPAPDVAATEIELHGISGSRVHVTTPEGDLDLELPLPGLYNVYNALAALTAGLRSGVSLERVREGLESMRAVFGRVETIEVSGKPVSILLIKNPAGANEVLRTLRLESTDGGIDLWLALNDRIADGRDVSWIWDADFELLADGVRRVICAGTRAPEMALRLKYAGWPEDSIEVIEPIESSLDEAVSAAPARLFALPTYTALLELRTLLAHRGLAADFWE